jgi:hypothetical protein
MRNRIVTIYYICDLASIQAKIEHVCGRCTGNCVCADVVRQLDEDGKLGTCTSRLERTHLVWKSTLYMSSSQNFDYAR